MSTQLQESFIRSMRDAEAQLRNIGFSSPLIEEKGFATYATFKSTDVQALFMFGPSDWTVEMILTTNWRKYGLKDLLTIREIAHWLSENKFQLTRGMTVGERMKGEVTLFSELLTFVVENRLITSSTAGNKV